MFQGGEMKRYFYERKTGIAADFIHAVGIGFGVGINAVIAFYLGAGDNKKADQAATQGLVLAMIHGVVMTVCCITMMPAF